MTSVAGTSEAGDRLLRGTRAMICKFQNSRKKILLASCAVVALSASQSAVAQATQNSGIETVVVTAEKRSEDIQKVPAAVSAISSETLGDLHATQLADIGAYVPALHQFGGHARPNHDQHPRNRASRAGRNRRHLYRRRAGRKQFSLWRWCCVPVGSSSLRRPTARSATRPARHVVWRQLNGGAAQIRFDDAFAG